MTHFGILLGLLFAGILQKCSALSCMECTDLPNPAFCGTVARCQSNSSCLTRQYVTSSGVTLFSSACVSDRKCQALPQRRGTHESGDVHEDSASDLETCDECCNDKDYCNLEGCGTKVTALQQRGPYCFKCNVEDEVTGCRTSTPCDSGQACFLSKSTFPGMYKTGCMPISNCNQTMDSSVLVGKRSVNGLSIALPHCCFGDFCNDIYKFIASPTTTVDGGWSKWGAWSACSQTCQETRSRSCDNPAPRNGGAGCHGNGTESKACATITGCPVDGGWSNWGDWSTCSVTCGAINGTMTRMRSCDNPPPKSSGATCQGMGQDSQACTATVASCAEAYCTSHNYDVVTVAGTSQKLCIKLSDDTKYWWYANKSCQNTTSDNSAHLVSILTEEANTAIGTYLQGRTGQEDNCKAHSYTVVPVKGTPQKLCLKLWHSSFTSWSGARSACQSVDGGDLVKITSAEANSAIGEFLHGQPEYSGFVWIGLRGFGDHHSQHYVWTDNSAAIYDLVDVDGGGGGGGGKHGGNRRHTDDVIWRRNNDVRCVLGLWGSSPKWWLADKCHDSHRYLCEIPM